MNDAPSTERKTPAGSLNLYHDVREAVIADAGAAGRRAALANALRQRTGLDEIALQRLVHSFYARARVDPELGPLFTAHIADWPAHEARMIDFWASVALLAGRYHRNTLQAHRPLQLRGAHFDRWLALFDETLRQEVSPQAHEHLLAIAQRIAATLRSRLCDESPQTMQTR